MIRHLLCALALGAAGCAPVDMLSRGTAAPAAYMPAYTLADVAVHVPETLEVSEDDNLYPVADIVWRGEEAGDRHAQVAAIFRDAADLASASLIRGPRVRAEIEVIRFHSLSEKARIYTGGHHDMRFTLTLVDEATGAVVMGPRDMHAILQAHGGAQAMRSDLRGEGMRVRIVRHLAGVLRGGMSVPAARLSAGAQVAATVGAPS